MATAQLVSELTCSICLEYYKDPVSLPCLHSFCKQCIRQFHSQPKAEEKIEGVICLQLQNEAMRTSDETKLECPQCRRIIDLGEKGVDGLPRNFTLANIVEKITATEKREMKKYPCDLCESDPPNLAVKSCKQCNISYCEICLKQCHPKRGKFSNHELVHPADVQNEATEDAEESNNSETVVECLKDAQLELQEIQKQTKQKIELIVKHAEVEKGKSIGTVKTAFEEIHSLLKGKEQEYILDFENRNSKTCNEREAQIESIQQFLNDIETVLTDIQNAVDGFQNNRILSPKEFEDLLSRKEQLIEKDISLDAVCAPLEDVQGLCIDTSHVETAIQNMQGKLMEDFVKTDVEATELKINCIPKQHSASIQIRWGENLSNIQVSTKCQNADVISETRIISGIEGEEYIMDNLQPETEYDVQVSAVGSEILKTLSAGIKTLPLVNCPEFVFDTHIASNAWISNDSKFLEKDDTPFDDEQFRKIDGTIGTLEFETGQFYWEIRATFRLSGRSIPYNHYAFETGICCRSRVDRVRDVNKSYNSYVIGIDKAKRNCAEYYVASEGTIICNNTIPNWCDLFEEDFGFFLDLSRNKFTIIDLQSDSVIYEFCNIKAVKKYVPVFSLGEDKTKCNIELITGNDIKIFPECLQNCLT